jgi:hypothetical protein
MYSIVDDRYQEDKKEKLSKKWMQEEIREEKQQRGNDN